MPGSTAVERANRCTLRAYLQRERTPLSERYDLAKRILAAVARRHSDGRPAGRIEPDTIQLTGLRSFRVELVDDGPASGVRRKGAHHELDAWAENDVRALGRVLVALLPDEELPASIVRVLATMTGEGAYADARLAMNAFARAVP